MKYFLNDVSLRHNSKISLSSFSISLLHLLRISPLSNNKLYSSWALSLNVKISSSSTPYFFRNIFKRSSLSSICFASCSSNVKFSAISESVDAMSDSSALSPSNRAAIFSYSPSILEIWLSACTADDNLSPQPESSLIKLIEIEKLDKEIFELCLKLTSLRKNAAEKLAACVIEELKTLNIPDACFAVKFNEYNFENANLHSVNGSDIVCFEFSANKGEPMKPMSKVISGGEMSRFMLAMKTQLKDLNDISTYIFDEIDAGISGYTADKVARKFTDIAGHTQILAVSHLAQICAASDAQYYIYKSEEGGKTLTIANINRLISPPLMTLLIGFIGSPLFAENSKHNDKEKIEEIIRLTGSLKSDAAVKHAEELISSFKNN